MLSDDGAYPLNLLLGSYTLIISCRAHTVHDSNARVCWGLGPERVCCYISVTCVYNVSTLRMS
jgi:hypothetical protein